MLGVHFMSDGSYPGRHVAESQEAAGRRGVRQDYYSRAVEAGEPPGRWCGPGLADLGLELGHEVTNEQMQTIYTALCHPETGEALGTPMRHYASPGENLVKVAERRGVDLPEDLAPEAVRAALGARKITDSLVEARVGALVQPEELASMKRQASKAQRHARSFADITASPDKTWSIFHAAAEATGNVAVAEQIEAAQEDGRQAALEVLMREAGLSRAGYHGKKTGGRSSGRWVDGRSWIVASFTHHLSREGDPQLHTHLAALNRVRCEDGVWRALDGDLIDRARPLAAAVYERASEESLARRLGVSFVTSPDGKSRRIVGVDQETIDLFSKRSASINARVDEWAKAYEQRNGAPPNERQIDAAARKIAMTKRRSKPVEMDARANSLAGWDRELSGSRGKRLRDVMTGVTKAGQRAEASRSGRVPAIDAEAVTAAAVAEVGRVRTHWTRYDLASEINRCLPDDLGGMAPKDVDALLERLTDRALRRPEVSLLTAPDVIGEVPPELCRGDGHSIYSPRDDQLFGLTATLSQEQRLVGRALAKAAPVMSVDRARAMVEASGLRADQQAAVAGVLSSGRSLEVLIGPAGTGKSYSVATLAKFWERQVGRGTVIGLTVSENAAQVLKEEGLANAANVALWLKAQERLAAGRGFPGEKALALRPGCLVVVDEASMVATDDLARISEMVEAMGGKVLLCGDDRQLGAVEGGGLLGLVAHDPEVLRAGALYELDQVGRFEATWEREASLRLRQGDDGVLDLYDRHGRIEDGTSAEMTGAAYEGYVTDTLAGRRSVLIVPTTAQGAELAARVRSELVALGKVSNDRTVGLGDGCVAGAGDLIQCRQNDRLTRDSTGRPVSNRDVFGVREVLRDGGLVVRRDLGRDEAGRQVWGKPFKLAPEYVNCDVQLAYASTVHAVQGRTVDTAHSLVDDRASRESLYVAATRGRQSNMIYVVTEPAPSEALGEPDPVVQDARAVLGGVLERTSASKSATEAMREQFDAAESLARLGPIWSDVCSQVLGDQHRAALVDALGPELAAQVVDDPAAPALWRVLQNARDEGHDVAALVRSAAGERELGSADSVAKVLHYRVEHRLETQAPDFAVAPQRRVSYVERTPEPAGLATPNLAGNDARLDYAHRVAAAMDRRVEVLGERVAEDCPAWAVAALGEVPNDSGARMDWTRRAGVVEAYREQYVTSKQGEDVTDPIGYAPSRGLSPDRYHAWRLADEALGHPDRSRDVSRLTDRQLRSAVVTWEEMKREAPAHVGDELRQTRRELRRREAQHERARAVSGDRPGRFGAARAAERSAELDDLRGRVVELDSKQSLRDDWWQSTEDERQLATNAYDELVRRHPDAGPVVDQRLEPEEVVAQMDPAKRARYERTIDAQRGWEDPEGLAIGLPTLGS